MSSNEELIRRIRLSLHAAVADLEPPATLLGQLRRELSADARGSWLSRSNGLRLGQRLRAGARALPILVAIGVVIAIAAVALTLPRHGHGSAPGPAANSGGPPSIPPNDPALKYLRSGRVINPKDPGCPRPAVSPPRYTVSHATPTELLSFLSVLRRPKQPGDALPPLLASRHDALGAKVVFVNYIRLARTVSGERYYLIPAITVTNPGGVPRRCAQEWQAALRRKLPHIPAGLRAHAQKVLDKLIALRRYNSQPHQSVCFFEVNRGGGSGAGGCGTSAASIKQRGSGIQSSQAPRPIAPVVYSGIVPDGVASVTLRFERASQPLLSFTVRPLENVFVLTTPPGRHGHLATIIWRNNRGQIINHIAGPAG